MKASGVCQGGLPLGRSCYCSRKLTLKKRKHARTDTDGHRGENVVMHVKEDKLTRTIRGS